MARLFYFLILCSMLLQAKPDEWYRNDDMASLYEALTKISSNSLYVDSLRDMPKDMLKNYIYHIDTYGDYYTKKEYQAFQKSLSPEYAGIGMILYQQGRGEKILCLPVNKQLEEKGISKYDELLSVDGHSVKGKNFYLVSSWIRGRTNSHVKLLIRKSSGALKTITIKRTEQHFYSTRRVMDNGIAMIRIIRFMHETPEELQSILHQWPKNIPLVIDLRGNGGGDFFAAVQSADLFLPEDTLISSIETTTETTVYHASNQDITKGRSVFVLQDRFTASAAEVFIAALTQNNRAESVGEKSFGKGVAQKFIPLSNGDALLLTYGKIITPNGKIYHKKGLLPTSDITLKAF
ncbi:S41 family peptidase [Sulfurovum sp.]|uniref:S41 family peptidase n=1 Tax=Sulfurovum sp. TaxID=1969726 RepID=UPI0025CBA05C|nr:S41 family peptidase [Sulfurovum sp.]